MHRQQAVDTESSTGEIKCVKYKACLLGSIFIYPLRTCMPRLPEPMWQESEMNV